MKIYNDSKQVIALNELFVDVRQGLPTNVENSVYYPKIKHLLFGEINSFCKEQVELKQDLNVLRMMVGEEMTESQIRDYLDGLMLKYNNEVNNVGIIYHIEQTRLDYGVPVVVIIKRDSIYVKKFVFRFKKELSRGIGDLNNAGLLKKDITSTLANKKLMKDGDA
jgi:hypothetical protein